MSEFNNGPVYESGEYILRFEDKQMSCKYDGMVWHTDTGVFLDDHRIEWGVSWKKLGDL